MLEELQDEVLDILDISLIKAKVMDICSGSGDEASEDEENVKAKSMDIGSGSEDEVSEDEENIKTKVMDIPTGSEDEESEDVENATEHQEATAKTLGYTEHNSAGSHHHISNVNPAQAGVSLIPLDDFSSVDTEANNLAHMVCSKGERLSLTLERVDQELPYQEATPTLEATTLEATAWSALVAMLGTLALVIGGGKKIAYLLTVLLYFVGSGGLHSHSSIYWEFQVQINTRSDTLFYSSQPWMKAVAEPHYLKRVRVRVRNEDYSKAAFDAATADGAGSVS